MIPDEKNNLLYNEKYVVALDYFCKSKNLEKHDDFLEYDEILWQISQTGYTYLDWEKLKEFIFFKTELILKKFQQQDPIENFDERLSNLKKAILSKNNPPFSLQRICELILLIPSYYQNSHRRYFDALEKLIRIDSYSRVLSPQEYNEYVQKNIAEIDDLKKVEPMQLVESGEIETDQQ